MTLTTEEQQALESRARIEGMAFEMLSIIFSISTHQHIMDEELPQGLRARIRRVLKEASND